MTREQGLPSLVGLNHIGYGVPDVDQAVAFFTDVLGLELEQRGRIEDPGGDGMRRWFDVDPAAFVNFAFLRLPDGSRLELVEWHAPDQATDMPKNSDVAGRHFALSVTDLDAAIAHLKAQPGVTVFDRHSRGFAYFSTPWGMYVQLNAV